MMRQAISAAVATMVLVTPDLLIYSSKQEAGMKTGLFAFCNFRLVE